MNKTTFFTLGACMLFALAVTAVLGVWKGKNPYHQFRGFRRDIQFHTLPRLDSPNLDLLRGKPAPEGGKLPIPSIYRQQLSPASYVVVCRVKGKNMLGKFRYPDSVGFVPGLLKGQQDDFFTTLGQLLVDTLHQKVVYVYLYRNEFMLMDSSLNLQYSACTIDTISRAKIKTATLDKTTLTLASPPLMVNEQSALQWPYLYVHSRILSANEDPEAFDQHRVIDVYDLQEKGRYCYSFYLGKD